MRNPERVPIGEWQAAEEQAIALFTKEQIPRFKKPILFIEREGDRVIGAVAGGVIKDTEGSAFAFDIVVDTKCRGRGVGKALIKATDSYYESIKHDLPDGPRAKIRVINPIVEDILQKLGYHFTHQSHYGSIMEKY